MALKFRYSIFDINISKPMENTWNRCVPTGLEEYAGDKQFATTLARGLELLHCFTPERPILGNSEMASMLNLPRATISRLTYTLMCLGYLTATEYYGKYQLGPATLSLGYPLLAQFTIRRNARPLMMKLAKNFGCNVSMAIRDRLSMVYIEVMRATAGVVYSHDVGSTHPLLGSSIGRAYLLGCTPSARESLINQVKIKEPDQWERYRKKVQENFLEFPQYGCCTAIGEVVPDVQAVAVPLGRIHGIDVAAMSCTFQGRALDIQWLRKEVAPQLQAIAREIT